MVQKAVFPVLLLTLFLFPPVLLSAGEGVKSSTDMEIQISSRPEVRLILSQSFTFPFLQGSSPLTSGNNIKTVFSIDATPISLAGRCEVIWTPVAFFLFSGGGQAGSGWNMPLGSGIGIVRPREEDKPRRWEADGAAFDGLIWHGWGAGTFQFDLGAVFPGPWNHVIFQTRQEFRYSAYTRAGANDLWLFENDWENRNGWRYDATYILGYMMPLSPVLNLVGVMAELKKPLYNTNSAWGEGLGRWIFSGLLNFSITPRFNTTLVVQFRTLRNYDSDPFATGLYYGDLTLENNRDRRRVLFHRAALLMNVNLR